MILNRILLIIFFLSSPVVADEAGEVVKLEFAMEAGLEAHTKFIAEQVRVKNGEEQVHATMNAEGRFRIEGHPEGLVIIQNFDDVDFDADMGEHTDLMTKMVETASAVETRYIISNNGEILGVEGLEPLIEILQKTTESIIDDFPEEVKSKLRNFQSQLINKDNFISKATEQWSGVVQQWLGAEFEKGFYYTIEYSEQVPAFGGVELGFNGTYEYLGKTHCNDTDTEQSCVELLFQSTLLPDSAEQFTNAMVKQLNLQVPDGFVISADTNLLLVTEPDTLKPHYLEKVKTITSLSDSADGMGQRIDRIVYVYSYN